MSGKARFRVVLTTRTVNSGSEQWSSEKGVASAVSVGKGTGLRSLEHLGVSSLITVHQALW